MTGHTGEEGAPGHHLTNDDRANTGDSSYVDTTRPTVRSGHQKLAVLRRWCDWRCEIFPVWWRDVNGVCACRDGVSCDRPGKHARVKWQYPDPGRSGATSDFAQVQEWHNLWPEANWAMRLDGLLVLDCDRKHGGLETAAALDENFPELLGITLGWRTYDGGFQLAYHQPPEKDIFTIAQGQLPQHILRGFEVKALKQDGAPGHYVLIPPSQGRVWLSDVEIADPSPQLLRVLRETIARKATGGGDSDLGEGRQFDFITAMTPGAIVKGQEDVLFRAAASLRAQGVNDNLALAVLGRIIECFVNTRPDEPWTEKHAEDKWKHAKKTYEGGRSKTYGPGAEAFMQKVRSRWSG